MQQAMQSLQRPLPDVPREPQEPSGEEMSVHESFETWAKGVGLRLERVVSGTRYESMETEWAFLAWRAKPFRETTPNPVEERKIVERLREYVEHYIGCAVHSMREGPCDCGLAALSRMYDEAIEKPSPVAPTPIGGGDIWDQVAAESTLIQAYMDHRQKPQEIQDGSYWFAKRVVEDYTCWLRNSGYFDAVKATSGNAEPVTLTDGDVSGGTPK